VDIGDGDLVRLARTGDAAAFRLLVERHRTAALARAVRLGARPGDADDIVQEAFLQAFIALDRLREPDRFGAWLAGIVLNVHRAATRRPPPLLLADWPEDLHPASVEGLPSAEDLDRAEALGAAVAGLPPGQRRAVELYYYAGLNGWITSGSSRAEVTGSHWDDYTVTAAAGTATLAAVVPHPYGDVFLGQEFLADDDHGTTVTLRAEIRARDVAGHGELSLYIVDRPEDPPAPGPIPQAIHRGRQEHHRTITGSQDWTSYALTAPVPASAEAVEFDLTLAGPGQIELRNVTLTRAS
jgi:RNA polymerase sigma-70 factor (ECF subfamily)